MWLEWGLFGRDLEFPLKLGPELFPGGCNAQVKFKDGDPENYRHGQYKRNWGFGMAWGKERG